MISSEQALSLGCPFSSMSRGGSCGRGALASSILNFGSSEKMQKLSQVGGRNARMTCDLVYKGVGLILGMSVGVQVVAEPIVANQIARYQRKKQGKSPKICHFRPTLGKLY